ncbi:MAG: hypothetical protein P8X90_36195 [Desulfobacterales bacterium]
MALRAAAIETHDALDAIELFYQRGWTDGLPIIPPTERRIQAMLDTVRMAPDTIIGSIPERSRVFTAEVVAINAVMAGCLRLVLINAGGSPEFDRATLGHPGKFTYCIAEDESTDWLPLHVQRGFEHTASTVTVFAGESPNQVNNHTALKAENILRTLADRMSALGTFNMGGQTEMAVIICPEHYKTLRRQGWDKARVQRFLYEKAARPLADLKKGGFIEKPLEDGDDSRWVRAVPSPDDILLVVAGGIAGRFSACIPGWASMNACHSVTRALRDASCGA